MALLTKIGYGQVEPNHLSAQRTGQIYAQLPMSNVVTAIENGAFVKYDSAAGECNFTGPGEWMLVYNEIKLYDKARQTYKDFILKTADAVGGKIYPRVFKVNVGDSYTTNMIDTGVAGTGIGDITLGAIATVGATGTLTLGTTPVDGEMRFQVTKKYTLPDGQVAVKVTRITDAA